MSLNNLSYEHAKRLTALLLAIWALTVLGCSDDDTTPKSDGAVADASVQDSVLPADQALTDGPVGSDWMPADTSMWADTGLPPKWNEMSSGISDDRELRAIWAASLNDIWAAGEIGVIIHYNGSAWQEVTSPTTQWINGLWGTSASNIWAVGDQGVILHYDGSAWSEAVPSEPSKDGLEAISGTSATDIWAVGDASLIMHYDGSQWTQVIHSATDLWLYSVWAQAPNNVWAGGGSGTIIHYDGSGWTSVTSNSAAAIDGIWGSSASDVWAVGGQALGNENTEILHYNGSAWSKWSGNPVTTPLFGLRGSTDQNVWAVGMSGGVIKFNGSQWASVDPGAQYDHFSDVWPFAPNNVWVVGPAQTIYHYAP